MMLGLGFAHSLGLLHGHFTTHNNLFDCDPCVQIGDFQPILVERTPLGVFSGNGWTLERNIEVRVKDSLGLLNLVYDMRNPS
jgi:hypothetical protein